MAMTDASGWDQLDDGTGGAGSFAGLASDASSWQTLNSEQVYAAGSSENLAATTHNTPQTSPRPPGEPGASGAAGDGGPPPGPMAGAVPGPTAATVARDHALQQCMDVFYNTYGLDPQGSDIYQLLTLRTWASREEVDGAVRSRILPLHTDRHAQLRQQEPWATLSQRFDDAAVHTCMSRLAQTYNRAQELRTRAQGDDQQFTSLVRNLCDGQYRVPPYGNSHPSVLSFVQN